MSTKPYDVELCRELTGRVRESGLAWTPAPDRYEPGDTVVLDVKTVCPETETHATFRIESFVGGGFAGQIYRVVLERCALPDALNPLKVGDRCALKILAPSRGRARFRNLLYAMGFQAPFSAELTEAACRSGLLWQRILRIAMEIEQGRPESIPEVYASFFDPAIRAYGEVREWIEGRTWRLEADDQWRLRRRWRTVDPAATHSPEYVAKRQFMARLVELMHGLGAQELARQYEWWTMKSQPNVLKRPGFGHGPGDGLCAVDFRAGLVLLPFLPMSPVDYRLILEGIRRGSLVQFDRADMAQLKRYAEAHEASNPELASAVEALEIADRRYRRSMPDIAHQGLRLCFDRSLRHDVRDGLVEAYVSARLVDEDGARRLRESRLLFALFYGLGLVPVLGRVLRRLIGHGAFRRHVGAMLTDGATFRRAGRVTIASQLIRWLRKGRIGAERARRMADRPVRFWCERLTLGLLPFPWLHRVCAEPAFVGLKLKRAFGFIRSFFKDPAFREQWLTDQVREGHAEGMLEDAERDEILAHAKDPFIAKYLECLGVHFATLPVTQIVSVTIGGVAAAWHMMSGGTGKGALMIFGGIVAFFQVFPVSPGSICRGLFVVYLMVRERNFHSYMIAAPVSFVKYIGYLAFPLEMVATYPSLSRFMASRWATSSVHIVPVFGEKGALLEHMVFDAFFNLLRIAGRHMRRHIRGILDVWLLAGVVALAVAFGLYGLGPTSKWGINLLLAVAALCVLPRVLFYPLLRRGKK